MKDRKTTKRVVCYHCSKEAKKTYNITKQKWSRKFRCSCGSKSFQWYNY